MIPERIIFVSRGITVYHYDLWYMSLYVGDRVVPHGPLHTVTYTRGRIDTIDSPDDEHLAARNMYRIEKKNIYRVIRNECRGFNNFSYTIHLR